MGNDGVEIFIKKYIKQEIHTRLIFIHLNIEVTHLDDKDKYLVSHS